MNAVLPQPLKGRTHDALQNAGLDLRRDHGGWRIGAHATGIGALVPIKAPFMVLGGWEGDKIFPIGHHDKAGLLPGHEGFDHHLGTGRLFAP